VERLMKRLGLKGVIRGKPVRTTIANPAAPCPLDHVHRQFRATCASDDRKQDIGSSRLRTGEVNTRAFATPNGSPKQGSSRPWAASGIPLELLRAILRKCVNEWEWLERAPQIRMLKEPVRRVRFLTPEEAERLLAVLPEHPADMAVFSLATGLRASNVTGLQWSAMDLSRRLAWVHPGQAKARKAIPVP
jgi:integrase